jgi:two-component system LytT family response regulator
MTGPSSRKLRAIVVDDEPLVRRGLARLIAAEPDVELIAQCGNGDQAVAVVRRERPDLLFLDVQMPGRNGLEVLAALGDDRPRAVIFVTAFDRYAIEAFDQHAVDYLLKPFDDRRFTTALARARERLAATGLDQRLERLLEALAPETRWLDRIPARLGARVALVPVAEIVWIEAADNYVRVHTERGKHLVRESLRNLEAQLDPGRFARIHRSAIVNLDFVTELVALPSGDHEVLTRAGRLRLSRSYRKAFEERLGRGLG